MSEEIELKLAVTAASLKLLSKNATLEPLKIRPSIRKIMLSTYFDTPGHNLRAAHVSLRIRRDGPSFTQTIKAKRAPDSLIMTRDEWEHPVNNQDQPDFSIIKNKALASLINDLGTTDAIQPLFSISIDREIAQLSYKQSEVEVSLDNCIVSTGNAKKRFSEIELELKKGISEDVYELACLISNIVNVRPSTITKADRGYDLCNPGPGGAAKAAPLDIKPGTPASEAFRMIARSCTKHFLANEALLRNARLPEAVHQTRVGLRRLRAAISLFRPVADDTMRASISQELRWIANRLGDARDLDVYIAQVLEPARECHAHDQAFTALLESYKDQRRRTYDSALRALRSRRCSKAIMNTVAWFEAGPWIYCTDNKQSKKYNQPVEEFAARQLDRRHKKILKNSTHFEKCDHAERHELRIALKKLRYASEFFASLYRSKEVKKYISLLTTLQDQLGKLNDIATGQQRKALSETEVKLRNKHSSQESELLKKTSKTLHELADITPFWQNH